MTAIALFAGLTLGLTVLAFALKSGLLYAIGIATWLVVGYGLYNLTWPAGNTFLNYASILVCILMTIVMTVQTLNYFLFSRRVADPGDEQVQADYRRKVYKITRKKTNFWDER
jgi:hypothetical protein